MAYRKIIITSSYKKNNLGRTLYDTVIKLKPKKIVEFGILHGYSTVAMAQALKDLGRGHIFSYDLFEDYPYKHGTKKEVLNNLAIYGVYDFVTVKKGNFFNWLKNPEDFDLLLLDISNDGEIIKKAVKGLYEFIKHGSVVIFEGGTKKRDNVDWMIKYRKTPIHPLKNKLGFKILDNKFPGLSIISAKKS